MPATIYALLVGVNQYLGGVPSLNGCVNDIKSVLEFLQGRTQGGKWALQAKLLTSGDKENPDETLATRQNVIDAFRQHLGQAGQEDIAFFYYSGHGSQERAPEQFWHLEPDRLDETLVLRDSRTPGGWDLADKELAALIADVAKKNPQVVVVLDCCHSGSGTRDINEGVRLAPTDLRDRPLSEFLPEVAALGETARSSEGEAKAAGWLTLPHGRHIVLSACRSEESAREKRMPNGSTHGLLTYYLLDTLQQGGPGLTYRDVFSRVASLVRASITDQVPVVAASVLDDLRLPFLGGAIVAQEPYYLVEWDPQKAAILKAGRIHGIQPPQDGESTELALFPVETQIEPGMDRANAVGVAKIVKVDGTRSQVQVEFEAGFPVPAAPTTFKAVVAATPLPPVKVALMGDDEGALDALRAGIQESAIVRLAESLGEADLRAEAWRFKDKEQKVADDVYHLARAGDNVPLQVQPRKPGPVPGGEVESAVATLEQMAAWLQTLQLKNDQTQLLPDAVRLELFRYEKDPAGGEPKSIPITELHDIHLRYDPAEGQQESPFQIRLTHTGKDKRKLYVMLVDLADDFSISTNPALFGGGTWLEPGQSAWATNEDGEPFIGAYVPDELVEKGITQVRDVLKLIVSTEDADATLLNQDPLDVVAQRGDRGITRGGGLPRNSLDRLLRRVQTRAIGGRDKKDVVSDWYTLQATITVEQAGEGVAIPTSPAKDVELAEGVIVKGHPDLVARARLVPFDEGKRGLGNLSLPAVFRTHPELSQPFSFRMTRSGDAGDSVIELTEVRNPQSVTPEQPLLLGTEAQLGEDECILPVAYDPETELFLPLGLGYPDENGVTIRIERLPDPTSDAQDGKRDVAGSIKLFFQKVVAEKLGADRFGLKANTARLAIAALTPDGQVTYDESPIALKEKVAAANSILLFIHGFTSDTRGMVRSAYGLDPAPEPAIPHLADNYDLLLAFDYENIGTSIEVTAQLLKKALTEAGLKAGHGKQFHIISHSLGTMVTRTFIEREGGKDIVQKAILAGPPNTGTPWAKYQDYAMLGLGAALNGLTAVTAPTGAIPVLIGTLSTALTYIEKQMVTLEELEPGSEFYKKLNNADDPRVPYVVVAGNTSKIQYASPGMAEAEKSLLQKLATKLTSPQTRNRLLALGFLDAPNDMAISLESMSSLPEGREPKPVIVETACDHISYFSTAEGLRQVADQALKA